jgi:hypothetical protein
VTSIFHPKLPHNKALWPRPLLLKTHVAPRRNDFCKSHVLIIKIDKFKWKDWARIKPCTYSKKNTLALKSTKIFLDLFSHLL